MWLWGKLKTNYVYSAATIGQLSLDSCMMGSVRDLTAHVIYLQHTQGYWRTQHAVPISSFQFQTVPNSKDRKDKMDKEDTSEARY